MEVQHTSGPNMSTRASGKPAARQSASTPATPYEGKKETKQETRDRLRTQRDVLLSKKAASAVLESDLREQVLNLQNQVGVLKGFERFSRKADVYVRCESVIEAGPRYADCGGKCDG